MVQVSVSPWKSSLKYSSNRRFAFYYAFGLTVLILLSLCTTASATPTPYTLDPVGPVTGTATLDFMQLDGSTSAAITWDLTFRGINYTPADDFTETIRNFNLTTGLNNIEITSGGLQGSELHLLRISFQGLGLGPGSVYSFLFMGPDPVLTGTLGGFSPSPVPEPSTILLLGTGLAGLAAWGWKKGKHA